MKSVFKPVLLAALLASAGLAAYSQAPQAPAGGTMGAAGPMMHQGMRHERMSRMDPARMQARIDKRLAALKAELKLAPAQEGAWTSFAAAMKPSADLMKARQAKRAERAEIAKLPTPERIDKMKALRTQRLGEMNTAMDLRGEATKVFYATLTPEQKKTFDAQTQRHQHRAGGWRGGPRDGKAAPAKS